MKQLALAITDQIRRGLDPLLKEEESGALYLLDNELGDKASCCTTGEAACFYVLHERLHGGDGRLVARRLAEDVRRRQLPSGAFGQPYYVKKGEAGTIDIAEIGAVANSLYHIASATDSQAARDSLLASADYLITQVALENPGAVYKNPNAKDHDVLNGDIYAAHTLGRAYQLTGRPDLLERATTIAQHVADRFGVHEAGWWPYLERWNGEVGMGNSVAYQGTILAFVSPLLPLLPEPLRQRWLHISDEATATILQAMQDGPNDDNEAPWWCRDWSNTWEVYLAFWRQPEHEEARSLTMERLESLNRELAERGLAVFTPKVQSDDPDRTPVSTTFRKAATFAGLFSYMLLDEDAR
ncbi:hypothetical protein J31TS4_27660 [Paenibacillus sp. J31TS4]|uniref:hypothetical protein n=1 Tax=Paenibacillus sp. J31TS4 TaxID=2807195 RepID=UPI001B0765BC|nr:hypothetical protein [Paenibacillus sp. J31TS4]GIP39486.1 hypothetical protein J31TS4_27660 [Paenibacillus sp. J31TS4]